MLRKKVVTDLLVSMFLGVLINSISQLLLSAPLSYLVALLCSLGFFILLMKLPQGMLARWGKKIVGKVRQLFTRQSGKIDPFHVLFDFHNEPVRVVYTCRARIDKAPCPRHGSKVGSRLKHVVQQHIPADEFLTQQLMLEWYKGQLLEENRERIAEHFECSYQLDILEKIPGDREWSRVNLPDWMYDNLLVIGENSCANLILDRLKPILNFYPHMSETKPLDTPKPLPKVTIDLIFKSDNGNTIDSSDKARLHTHFSANDANAVAMICYAPNPFRVQKRVLLLFGCHRVGQYLLEDWLRSPQSVRVLQNLIGNSKVSAPFFGQIALSGPFNHPIAENYRFDYFHLATNRAANLPFFPFGIPSKRTADNGFEVDVRAVQQNPMVDISLIIRLSEHDRELPASIDNLLKDKLPFLNNQYWESAVSNIGLHVTLYEFATHESLQSLAESIEHFDELKKQLTREFEKLPTPHLELVGFEVFPSSIVIYADLPTSFLESIQAACSRSTISNAQFFNRLRMPFPMHCTVIRFREHLDKNQQEQLQNFAGSMRKHVLGHFDVREVTLLLAKKQPYQDPTKTFKIAFLAQTSQTTSD
jgi:hypothetical protein